MHTYNESLVLTGGNMKSWARLTGRVTLGLGALSFSGLIYELFAYGYFRPRTINYVPPGDIDETLSMFIGIAMLTSFAFHIVAMLTTVYHTQLFGDTKHLRKAALAFGIISFMSIFAGAGCLSDIGKEAPMGWEVASEWTIAYIAVATQALFHGFMLVTVLSGLRSLRSGFEPSSTARDETVFYAVHYTGLLCGAVGFYMTILKLTVHTSVANLRNLVLYWDTFIIAPYLLIAAYWLFIKRKERIGEWYDEKQFSDIGRAGFLTLVLAIPFMAAVYAVDYVNPDGRMGVLWFPFILHFVLVSFSGMTLYFRES